MRIGQASRTANVVAQSVVGLGYDPTLAQLLPAGAAETTERLLAALGLRPAWMNSVARSPIARRLSYRLGNRLGAHPVAFGLRKRFVDDEVRAAIAGGVGQVLVVGAGYDTLALRLAPVHPALTFVEIDHPATHASKRAGMAALGAIPSNLHLLGVDLGEVSLPQALAGLPAWDRTRASVVVAESCPSCAAPSRQMSSPVRDVGGG